ncbi:MAG: glycosyltransferase family 2 protein [Patescibacteria group bacterium]
MPKVSVHIVTHNSQPFLESVLLSLEHQTFSDWSVLLVDNASSDGTLSYLAERWPQYRIVRNRENAGYARAHNQAIHFTESDYVLTLNPDVILHEWYLARVVEALDQNQHAGSATGKILRAQGNPGELGNSTFSRTLDSTGILIDRRRWFRDRGAGEEDRAQYDSSTEIFGPSGAAALYRRKALESTAYREKERVEYFDELFHSYKEDVDLAWRLQRRGWRALFVPRARAYHYRRAGTTGTDLRTIWHEHASRTARITFLSYRNHIFLLVKNERWLKNWKELPWLLSWEFGKIGYLLCTHPIILFRAWLDVMKNWRVLIDRRKYLK